jgi:hypothetical protein
MTMIDDAIQAIRMGRREEGRRLLEEILETNENNEQVWLWLTSVVDSDEDREVCLENVLALNPNNTVAQKGLEALHSGTFNVHDIMSQAVKEEEVEPGPNFLDEFQFTDSSLEDDLVMPSTMAQGKPTAAKKTGGGINFRLIALIAFVLLVVLALAGLAVARSLLGGDESGTPPLLEEATQPAPAGVESTPLPTDTPTTAPPTDTPTPTHTPLELPTPRPTDPPTPTATPVVPPTPG